MDSKNSNNTAPTSELKSRIADGDSAMNENEGLYSEQLNQLATGSTNSSKKSSLPNALNIPKPQITTLNQGTDFVKKLFQMLEENKYTNIVQWNETGDSFLISDTNEFTKQVLPCYFKHSNFSSFVRQLNKYDFHKVKMSQEIKQRYQLENVWEFKHPNFNRFDQSALESIKRKVPAKKDSNENSTNVNCVPLNSYRKLEDRIAFLERENFQLQNQLGEINSNMNNMNEKFNSLVSNLLTSRNIDATFSKSIEILAKGLNQLGVQLPHLELPHLEYLNDESRSFNKGSLPTHQTGHVSKQLSQTINQPSSSINQQPQQSHLPQDVAQQRYSKPSSNKSPPVKIEPENTNTSNDPLKPTIDQQSRLNNRPQGSALHVLLVEDDDVCIQLCRKFLMKYGCTVVVVTDGLSAIAAVEQVKFDLVLMDIVMPNLDGASATSIIRSFDSDTPIIAMTGNYQRNDLVTYLNHGMTDILAKPFTKDDLYMILEKHQINRHFFIQESPQTQQPQKTPVQSTQKLSNKDELPQPPPAPTQKSFPKSVSDNDQSNISLNGSKTPSNSSIPPGLVSDLDVNLANIPNVNDDLLTPGLLDSTGLTPDPSSSQQELRSHQRSSQRDLNSSNGSNMNFLNVDVDDEFGSMFKRQKM